MVKVDRAVNEDNIVELAQSYAMSWENKYFSVCNIQQLIKDLNAAAGFEFIDWDKINIPDYPGNSRAFVELGVKSSFSENRDRLFTIIYDKNKKVKSIVVNGPKVFWAYKEAAKEVAHRKEVEEQERMASEALQAAQREERLKEYKPFNEIIMDMQHGDRAVKWTEDAEQEGKVGFSRSYDDYKYFQEEAHGPLKLSSVFVNGLYKLVPKLYSAYRAVEALEAGHTVRYYKEGSSSPHVEISPEDYLSGLANHLGGIQVKELLAERWSIIYKTEE